MVSAAAVPTAALGICSFGNFREFFKTMPTPSSLQLTATAQATPTATINKKTFIISLISTIYLDLLKTVSKFTLNCQNQNH
jgi:hypothetical protein